VPRLRVAPARGAQLGAGDEAQRAGDSGAGKAAPPQIVEQRPRRSELAAGNCDPHRGGQPQPRRHEKAGGAHQAQGDPEVRLGAAEIAVEVAAVAAGAIAGADGGDRAAAFRGLHRHSDRLRNQVAAIGQGLGAEDVVRGHAGADVLRVGLEIGADPGRQLQAVFDLDLYIDPFCHR
jgi:hypothetical protein